MTSEIVDTSVEGLGETGFDKDLEYPYCIAMKFVKLGYVAIEGPILEDNFRLAQAAARQLIARTPIEADDVHVFDAGNFASPTFTDMATANLASSDQSESKKKVIIIKDAGQLLRPTHDAARDDSTSTFLRTVLESVSKRDAGLIAVAGHRLVPSSNIASTYREFSVLANLFGSADARFTFDGISEAASQRAIDIRRQDCNDLKEELKLHLEGQLINSVTTCNSPIELNLATAVRVRT